MHAYIHAYLRSLPEHGVLQVEETVAPLACTPGDHGGGLVDVPAVVLHVDPSRRRVHCGTRGVMG